MWIQFQYCENEMSANQNHGVLQSNYHRKGSEEQRKKEATDPQFYSLYNDWIVTNKMNLQRLFHASYDVNVL